MTALIRELVTWLADRAMAPRVVCVCGRSECGHDGLRRQP